MRPSSVCKTLDMEGKEHSYIWDGRRKFLRTCWLFLHFPHNFPSPGPLGDGIRHATSWFGVAEREAGKTRTEHMISTGDQHMMSCLAGKEMCQL